MVKFPNTSSVSTGLMVSSSPQHKEMWRVVNISQSSSEETFLKDLDRELFEKTPAQHVIHGETQEDLGKYSGSEEIVKVYRLDENIREMNESQIESSGDILSTLLLNVWNDRLENNTTRSIMSFVVNNK